MSQAGPTSCPTLEPAVMMFPSARKHPVDADVAPSSPRRDALMEALAANPQFKVLPRSGKGSSSAVRPLRRANLALVGTVFGPKTGNPPFPVSFFRQGQQFHWSAGAVRRKLVFRLPLNASTSD